jgi:Transcriptional regulator PadR-like family
VLLLSATQGFFGDALRRVQLWDYEGTSEKDATKATEAALEYLVREAGAVHSYELPAGLALADGQQHGYAILQEVAQRTDGTVQLSTGTLYRLSPFGRKVAPAEVSAVLMIV